MSKTDFLKWFNESVKGRWPKWEVSECVLGDWFSVFGGYDVAVLTEAVRRHRIYDDPAIPSTKRLLEIVRRLQPPKPVQPTTEKPKELLTVAKYWEKVRTTYSKEERIDAILRIAKWHPHARDKDPQAYDWAVEQGLIQRAAYSVQRTACSGQGGSGHHNPYTPRADAWAAQFVVRIASCVLRKA